MGHANLVRRGFSPAGDRPTSWSGRPKSLVRRGFSPADDRLKPWRGGPKSLVRRGFSPTTTSREAAINPSTASRFSRPRPARMLSQSDQPRSWRRRAGLPKKFWVQKNSQKPTYQVPSLDLGFSPLGSLRGQIEVRSQHEGSKFWRKPNYPLETTAPGFGESFGCTELRFVGSKIQRILQIRRI